MQEVALLLFALVPAPYNFGCLFLNGLPLGMVFGLVLSFLEGRRLTEALAAGLCASFIVALSAAVLALCYMLHQQKQACGEGGGGWMDTVLALELESHSVASD